LLIALIIVDGFPTGFCRVSASTISEIESLPPEALVMHAQATHGKMNAHMERKTKWTIDTAIAIPPGIAGYHPPAKLVISSPISPVRSGGTLMAKIG
jgi:hypothetical protein